MTDPTQEQIDMISDIYRTIEPRFQKFDLSGDSIRSVYDYNDTLEYFSDWQAVLDFIMPIFTRWLAYAQNELAKMEVYRRRQIELFGNPSLLNQDDQDGY